MLISIAQAQVFFLVVTRILATIIHVPVLGGNSIPNQVKIALGITLAVVMVPWTSQAPATEAALSLFPFTLAIGREILIGTVAGYSAAVTFGAVQMAGETMGLGSGFGSGRILNPTMGESGSPIDAMFFTFAMLLFLVLNGHHLFLLGLQKTFEIIPVNSTLPVLQPDRIISLTTGLIVAGIRMALPVMGALLLADLVLGLLARVAPQVQVFFLGMPLKIGVGLLVFSVALVTMIPLLEDLFQQIAPRMLMLLAGEG